MSANNPPFTGDTSPRSLVDGGVNSTSTSFTFEHDVLSSRSQQLQAKDVITVVDALGIGGNARTIFSLCSTTTESQPNGLSIRLQTTTATTLPRSFLEEYAIRELPEYLQPGNALHVLISTLSGIGLAPAFFEEILHPLLRGLGLADEVYTVTRTSSAESVTEFARDMLLVGANKGKKQTLLMLSGDGGMVDTINGLIENGTRSNEYNKPILIQIPLGTGNALFHSLHKVSTLPSLYIQSLRTLLHGTPKPLPIFKATFSPGARLLTNEARTATPLKNDALYGAVVASYGFHATLVADSDTTEYRKHGYKRFGLVAKDLLFPEGGEAPHAYEARVRLDGRPMEGGREEHGYVLVTLVSNLERTFTISPSSKPLDGKLRVVNFGAMGGNETMEVMKAVYDGGKHVNMENVGYEVVEKMRIQFNEEGEGWKWRRCCVDGLIVGVEEEGWMEVEMVPSGEEAVMIVVDGD